MPNSLRPFLTVLLLGCGEQKLTALSSEPDVDIASHSDGDGVDEGMMLAFLAVIDDADDPEEELVATWTAGDRVVCDTVAVSDFGESICNFRVWEREGDVTVLVTDPKGASGADVVHLEVLPTDPPVVSLTAPLSAADGGQYYSDIAVQVAATASDEEDFVEDLSLSWSVQDAATLDDVVPVDLPETPDSSGSASGYLALEMGVYNIGVTATDTTGKIDSDSVQITVGGPNQLPACAWVSPDDGTVLTRDEPTVLRGMVTDPNWPDEADQLTVNWASDRDGPLGDSTPASDGSVSLTASDLSVSGHTLTLTAVDEVGASCTAERSLTVTTRPEVVLVRPVGEVLYYVDYPVALEGLVSDEEDAPDALTAAWESSADGALDVSPDLDPGGATTGAVMLSEGEHIVTLTGTDADGVSGSATSTISVRGPNQVPTCTITDPESDSGGAEGVTTTFSAVVDDVDIGPEALVVTWTSDLDGEVGVSTPSSDGSVSMSTGALTVGTHTVSMTAVDEVGAACVDSIRFIVGRSPLVSISSPIDGGMVNQGETVTLLGSATDADEDEATLSVRWTSDRDGTLFEGAPDSAGLTLSTVASLTVGDHAITLTATDGLGLTGTAIAVLTVNGLPTTPTVRITPNPAVTTDTLGVVFDVSSVDPELDPVTYRYEWFRDGVLAGEAGTVSPGDTTKHEVWEVRVTPTDGSGDGIGGVASRTIQNTLPVISGVEIGPDAVMTNTLATSVITAVDPDGDSLTFTHQWSVNSAPAGDSSATLDGLDWFDKHDVLELSVTPADDDGSGAAVAASAVMVQNAPPSAPGIALLPEDAVGGFEPLLCSIEVPGHDLDGDPVLYTIDWEREGDDYPAESPEDTGMAWLGPLTDDWTGDTVPAVDTNPEEEWTCTVTSWDDEESGGSATESQILSAPPPGCGDGILQAGEEYEPPPGPFMHVSVDPETCRWDFSDVEQLYCYGFCSWAGPPGCDDADADVLCKLITDNPESEALTYTITAPLSSPGFPGVYCDYGTLIDTDRGVPDVSWMDESMAAHHGGGGEVVAFPDCTDP